MRGAPFTRCLSVSGRSGLTVAVAAAVQLSWGYSMLIVITVIAELIYSLIVIIRDVLCVVWLFHLTDYK